jgi:ribonuclease P protein component
MIAKKYRLSERELKKVLSRGKPFFSRGMVLNYSQNKKWFHRFWIVLSWKSCLNSVHRNFFRRSFYNSVSPYLLNTDSKFYDFVFVQKKQCKLDKNDKKNIANYENDIHFLLRKILN